MDDKVYAGKTAKRFLDVYESKPAWAKLRRGVAKPLGEMPELMCYVFFDDLDTEKSFDQALYTALTLYAIHQQGRESNVNEGSQGKSFGSAVKQLLTQENENAIKRRFDKVLTAKDLDELATHARGLANLMRNSNVTLDYVKFVFDLYKFQNIDKRRKVVLSWGKDYYSKKVGEED